MKLEKKAIEDLRKRIEERLEGVPQGKRIHIDKDLLEKLLFDVIIYDDTLQAQLKIPVWSGDFLSKIDLSEVSFEDVSWCIHDGFKFDSILEEISERHGKRYEKLQQYAFEVQKHKCLRVVYTNTNADIDFKKSWEYKMLEKTYISECDFSGTDLSQNNNDKIDIRFSDLRKTGIRLLPGKTVIMSTNLEGVDLSSFEVDFRDMGYNYEFISCNLRNTGIRIKNFSKKIIEEGGDLDLEELKNQFEKGEFDGCYINGKLIKTQEERQEIAQQMRMHYQQIRDELVRSTLSDIDNQINGMKK